MPARITQNILSTGAIEQVGPERILEFIYKIWDLLNSKIGQTHEFGAAIVLFTEHSQYLGPYLYARKPNISLPNIGLVTKIPQAPVRGIRFRSWNSSL